MQQYITLVPKIAWRNIWRNTGRSLIVIGAVAIGIWALIFLLGFVRGTIDGYIGDSISRQTSHIQIHHPAFIDDREIAFAVDSASALSLQITELPEVTAVSTRILINAMVSTAHGVRGLQITGIAPDAEGEVTGLDAWLVEGEYLSDDRPNEILISRRIADKLNTGLRKKVVVTFQNTEFDITTAAFRVAGIFESRNTMIDESKAFVCAADLLPLTGLHSDQAHEIAVLLNEVSKTEQTQVTIAAMAPQMLVRNFREISPDLDLFDSQIRINMIIMTSIIMLALIFGIINTMLMAVLERIRELGMLMAVGMTRIRVFLMVMWETIFVSVTGAPLGMLLGYGTIRILHRTGIDLSMWAGGLEQWGLSTIVRPNLESEAYALVAVAIVITALLASIYPALKAIRLRPVEALRKL